MTIKFLENTHKSQVNPIKTKQKPKKSMERKQIPKFKPNLKINLLTKRKESIIISVQFDWNASNGRLMVTR